MLKEFGNEDRIKIYSCLGGTPHYLARIDPRRTFEENIKRLYFDIAGYLYNEPMMLLRQELREPAMYNSIIGAIAGGASRINEIATKLGDDSSKVAKYLRTLLDLRIVEKEYPFGEDRETSRKGIYKIADSEVFTEKLSDYIGKPPFEEICRQYLIRQNRLGGLPFTATSFGTWWGNDPKAKAQSDFDLIAADRKNKKIILGECKWKNSLDDVAEIRKLLAKEHLLPEFKDRSYYFFSKIPFSQKARALAEENKMLRLVTLEDLFR